MPISITPDAHLLVSLQDDEATWIGEPGVLVHRDRLPEPPYVSIELADRLQLGQEILTTLPTNGAQVVLVFDASGIWLREPTPMETGLVIGMSLAPPPVDPICAQVDEEEPSVLAIEPAKHAAALDAQSEDEIVSRTDLSPLVAGLQQFFTLRDLVEANLDLMSAEADMLCDAADLAVDQVQDMRIAWLEEGPEVEISDILLEAALMATLGAVATRVAGELIRRGFRSWARGSASRKLKGKTSQVNEKEDALGTLRKAHAKAVRELKHDLETQDEYRVLVYRYFVGQRKGPFRQSSAEHQLRNQREQVRKLEQQAAARAASMAELEGEVKAAQDALKDLRSRLGRLSQGGRVTDEALKEMVAAPLREAIPIVSDIVGDTLQSAAEKGGLPKLRQAAADDKSPLAGHGPSALIRVQVLELRRTQRARIARIRGEVARLGELVTVWPEVVLTPAIAGMVAVADSITEPPLARNEYREALLDLALEMEFSIWSALIGLFMLKPPPYTYTGETFIPVPQQDLGLEGAPKRVLTYLLERFRPVYGDGTGGSDESKLLKAMRKRRTAVDDSGTWLNATLGRDPDEPLAVLLRPAVMRKDLIEESPPPPTSPPTS